MTDIVPTICRLCIAHCGVLAEVEDDNGRRKVTRVTGDPDNPLFKGYTCPKGRALPELHNHEGRLLHSMKRQADGSHAPIASEQAAVEVFSGDVGQLHLRRHAFSTQGSSYS